MIEISINVILLQINKLFENERQLIEGNAA